MRLVLGSASPRRRDLLATLGLVVDEVRPPHVDETPHKGETPREYVKRIARAKAAALVPAADEVIVCADTAVCVGRRILGKPENEDEARAFLGLLSGRRHRVLTSVVVRTAAQVSCADVVSRVKMDRLSAEQLDAYIATGDWRDKAGGYAIQGPAGAFIPWISGSYTAIMGLPLAQTAKLLRSAGIDAGINAGVNSETASPNG